MKREKKKVIKNDKPTEEKKDVKVKKEKKNSISNTQKVINKMGGKLPAAKKIGVTYTTIASWVKRNKIPAEKARKVFDKLGKKYNITLNDLRPDLWKKGSK